MLALYLGIAPFGGNLEGVRAASLAYFGKEPRRLTLGEAALLVALPQSPEARRPDRSQHAARIARDRVLDRVAGLLPESEIARAKAEPVPAARMPMPMLAPIAAEQAVAQAPDTRVHQLTIDAVWQKSLEALARARARALGPDVSVAILAVDHATGEILAKVASADYFDARRAGHVDMTQALRSPGSTLKPFIYGIGFEDGFIHPETLIDDRPARYGSYAPENFDLKFPGHDHGSPRACSCRSTFRRWRCSTRSVQAGSRRASPRPARRWCCRAAKFPGSPWGWAASASGSAISSPSMPALRAAARRSRSAIGTPTRRPPPRRLLEPVAAWYVANILLGAPPPENAAGGRIAFKTGTSYGYRDAWAVGFDGKRTIGVWVGRPDGAPTPGLIGRSAAAPILFEAFARSGKMPAPLPHAPKNAIFASNAKLPVPLQRFRPEGVASSGRPAGAHPVSAQRGEARSRGAAPRLDPVAIKIAGGTQPLTVLVNGAPVATTDKRTVFVAPDGPGFVRAHRHGCHRRDRQRARAGAVTAFSGVAEFSMVRRPWAGASHGESRFAKVLRSDKGIERDRDVPLELA